jgi:hypothetical protein
VIDQADQDLYGIWREHVPANFDVDAALKEIRREWEKEWGGCGVSIDGFGDHAYEQLRILHL